MPNRLVVRVNLIDYSLCFNRCDKPEELKLCRKSADINCRYPNCCVSNEENDRKKKKVFCY